MKRFPGKKLLAVLLAVVCLPLTAFAAFAVGQGRAARSGVSVVVDGGGGRCSMRRGSVDR